MGIGSYSQSVTIELGKLADQMRGVAGALNQLAHGAPTDPSFVANAAFIAVLTHALQNAATSRTAGVERSIDELTRQLALVRALAAGLSSGSGHGVGQMARLLQQGAPQKVSFWDMIGRILRAQSEIARNLANNIR